MTKQAALIALSRNRGELDARLLARLLACAVDGRRFDGSFQTDARAELARPEVGTASGASAVTKA